MSAEQVTWSYYAQIVDSQALTPLGLTGGFVTYSSDVTGILTDAKISLINANKGTFSFQADTFNLKANEMGGNFYAEKQ